MDYFLCNSFSNSIEIQKILCKLKNMYVHPHHTSIHLQNRLFIKAQFYFLHLFTNKIYVTTVKITSFILIVVKVNSHFLSSLPLQTHSLKHLSELCCFMILSLVTFFPHKKQFRRVIPSLYWVYSSSKWCHRTVFSYDFHHVLMWLRSKICKFPSPLSWGLFSYYWVSAYLLLSWL